MYRVYLVQQKRGLFSDDYYDYDSFFFPSLTAEEVNKFIIEANELGVREDKNKWKWKWKMNDGNKSELFRTLEIIHNETDCLMPPEIWVKHNLCNKGYNIS
tara:strand:+ start:206 stop:508 length:303 start_codon:yes stop_codon:yes gene_type:complete